MVSVESRNWFHSGGRLVLRRRIVAGRDVESSVEFCGNEFGDVLAVELEEPVDDPGTTIGTKASVLHWMFLSFKNEVWFLTTGPLKGISVIFADFTKR